MSIEKDNWKVFQKIVQIKGANKIIPIVGCGFNTQARRANSGNNKEPDSWIKLLIRVSKDLKLKNWKKKLYDHHEFSLEYFFYVGWWS